MTDSEPRQQTVVMIAPGHFPRFIAETPHRLLEMNPGDMGGLAQEREWGAHLFSCALRSRMNTQTLRGWGRIWWKFLKTLESVGVCRHVSTMSNVLGVFDRAYVINRDQDVDRMKLATERLTAVEIPFERFPARLFTDRGKYPWIGMRGANASHLAIVETARDENLSNVLIMEDDVIFRENFHEMWSKISPALSALNYDIFFGYNWWNTRGNPESLRLARINKTVCVHFWAISSCFYESFIAIALANEASDNPACIDEIFNSANALMYAPTYNLVGQDEGTSLVSERMPKNVRWHADKYKNTWLGMKCRPRKVRRVRRIR